jgi:hypothetical protein
MAIGWLTALKMVPWDVVVSNAPGVVDGARKLWSAAGKNNAAESEQPEALTGEPRLAALEEDVANLQREMASSAELIKALADQNAQLVHAVAVLRRRQRLLTLALAALATAAAIGVVVLLT